VRISRTLAFVLAWMPAACGRVPARAPERAAPAAERPAETRQTYRPPADGRLSAKQVERYMAVWKHVPAPPSAETLRPTPFAGRVAALGDVTDSPTPDVKVALDQGWNEGEYLWVRERILEAEAAHTTARLNENVLAMLERTIADLETRAAAATDEGSRTLLKEQIAAFSDERARVRREGGEREPETVRANVRTLEPYRGKLDAMKSQIDRVWAVASGTPPRHEPVPGRDHAAPATR
jgi:hypothetical protein